MSDGVQNGRSLIEPQARLIIAGSRGVRVTDEEISDAVFAMGISISEVISGMCPDSPDMDAVRWAERYGIPLHPEPVSKEEWRKFKRAAGPMRNRRMAERATHLLAFWDGESSGTADMARQMNQLGKPGLVIRVSMYANLDNAGTTGS